MKYLHGFEVTVPENLTDSEGGKSNLTMKKPSRHRLNHVVKVSVVRNQETKTARSCQCTRTTRVGLLLLPVRH